MGEQDLSPIRTSLPFFTEKTNKNPTETATENTPSPHLKRSANTHQPATNIGCKAITHLTNQIPNY